MREMVRTGRPRTGNRVEKRAFRIRAMERKGGGGKIGGSGGGGYIRRQSKEEGDRVGVLPERTKALRPNLKKKNAAVTWR